MNANRLELRAPSNQTVVDIFEGSWITDLKPVCGVENTGSVDLFNDGRLVMAASSLGSNNRFDGYSMLELGPLEAAQTYQLERLGAKSVLAVESNTSSFLRCLIVKDVLSLKARFLCGDAIGFLRNSYDHFDLVFCCGFLYHMSDPVELIKQICIHCDRCFVWSHYYMDETDSRTAMRVPLVIKRNGFETTYYESEYPSMEGDHFLGGNIRKHAWLRRDEITRAFAYFGLQSAKILADETDHVNGAAFSCAYSRI